MNTSRLSGPLMALILFLLALTGCGKKSSQEGGGQVFRYNQHTGITSLDPAFSRDQATMWAAHQLFDGLVEVNDKLEVVPAMAKRWSLADSGRLYEFILRDDVYFHDSEFFEGGRGRRAVASDFVYSFNRLLDESVASTGAWLLRGKVADSAAFEAVNDTVLRIRLQVPYRPFLGVLTLPYFSVVPHEVAGHYGRDFRLHPVGTGPFRLKIWDEGKALVLVRNPSYYQRDAAGAPLPYLDAVRVSFIADRQAEFEQLRQGKLDLVSGIDPAFKDLALHADGSLREELTAICRLEKSPYLNTEYLGFAPVEGGNAALRDKRVRQAINYGIDRERMLQFLRSGLGTPAHAGMIPVGLPAYNETAVPGYRYDRERAAALLSDAGYPGGQGIGEIRLATSSGYADLSTYIARSLEDIGLQVRVDMMDPSLQRELMRKDGLEFFRASWIGDFPDGENYLALFYGKHDAPPNYTRFQSDRFDSLYERAIRESDPAVYIPLYQEMERIVLEEAPVVPLFYDEVVRFVNRRVSGLPLNAMNLLDLKAVRVQ